MGRVADDGLVEIPNLHRHAPLVVGQRTEIAEVAVAADPYGGAVGDAARARLKPLVELHRAAAHIGMRRAGHLQIAGFAQPVGAFGRAGHKVASSPIDLVAESNGEGCRFTIAPPLLRKGQAALCWPRVVVISLGSQWEGLTGVIVPACPLLRDVRGRATCAPSPSLRYGLESRRRLARTFRR